MASADPIGKTDPPDPDRSTPARGPQPSVSTPTKANTTPLVPHSQGTGSAEVEALKPEISMDQDASMKAKQDIMGDEGDGC